MNRRQFLSISATVSLAGCLRMQGGETDGTTENPTGTIETTSDTLSEETDQNDAGNELFSSREEAIAFAAEPASNESEDLGSGETNERDGIQFSLSSRGSSMESGPGDSLYSSEDMNIESIDQDVIEIAGGTDLQIQVRDLAGDSTASFTLASGFEDIHATRINIDFRGSGALRDETPKFYDEQREETATYLTGEWRGDVDMFGASPFGNYVITLLENGDEIAKTGNRVHGIGYQWQFDQTEQTAFFTRHSAVNQDWEAALIVGEQRTEVLANHLPDEQVFAFDIGKLDLDSGRYRWQFELREPNTGRQYHRYLSMRSALAKELIIV